MTPGCRARNNSLQRFANPSQNSRSLLPTAPDANLSHFWIWSWKNSFVSSIATTKQKYRTNNARVQDSFHLPKSGHDWSSWFNRATGDSRMLTHKFKIGQHLLPVRHTSEDLPDGAYVIIKRLPKRNHEGIAREGQLRTNPRLFV
jgi:hypothetical protein